MNIPKLADELKRSGFPAQLKNKGTLIVINGWMGTFEIIKSRSRNMYFVSRLFFVELFVFISTILSLIIQLYLPDQSSLMITSALFSFGFAFLRIVKGHSIKKNIEQFLADRNILL